ncbi:LuxR C-terminal-related transcriptional regulator [Kitasatospora purpeofusca]|uniref:helix-turn-helix transcriptional regulator n=1 Tax=Kitasatospora purpeofusca TaxID=67352 RepID=UPI003F4A8943
MEAETEQAADAAATIPGVDSAAVTLYRWTVVHGRLTPATLAQAAAETGIGEPDCRRALAALTEACLLQAVPAAVPAVVPDDGRSAGPGPTGSGPAGPETVGWQPVSPQAATAQLLSDRDTALRAQEEALRAQRRRIQQERDGLAALVPVYLQARQHAFPQGTIDHLPDKFAVRALLCDVIDSCRSEVLVSKHGGSFPPAALREALPRDLALLGRGIRMRSLYQHATRFDQPTRLHAEQLIGAGAEVRTLPEVLPQMIIVDGALALLPARSGGALVIREPDLLAYLLDVFARDWENATPFATGPQAAHDIAVTVKQSILVLLAKGLKDESIARRLGISLRTCRRHVSEILEGLGAHSRFQAGVFAERRGLTAHPAPAPASAPAPKPSPDAPAPACASEAACVSEPACASESADPAAEARCPACGASLAQQQRPNGRPPTYCSSRCRSRAYRARGKDRAPGPVTKPADAVT